MSKFEDQLARMQGLMNYGIVSESKDEPSTAIEHQKVGADGKSYAIIKENAKYFIKSTDSDKANLVESYDYIDSWNQRDKHSYDSYSEASKNFDMKMSSLNEAYANDIRKENLNTFINESYMTEGTESMLSEIARQRQIMHNAAVIMNEASEISMNNTSDPERESGNSGDKNAPFTDKAEATLDKDPKQASGKPESMGEPYGDKTKAPQGKDIQGPDGCVASQHPTGGKVAKVNEEAMPSGEITDEGLPAQPGTGSPDGHLMEDEEFEVSDEEPMDSEEDAEAEPDLDLGGEDEEGSEDFEGEDDLGDEEFDDEDLDDEEFDDEDLEDDLDSADEPEDEIDSLRSEIEELQARLDALENGESDGTEDVDPDDLGDEELSDEEMGDDEVELEDEPIEGNEDFDEEPVDTDEFEDEEEPELDLGEMDANDMMESISQKVASTILKEERKKQYMESIVSSVVGNILSEETTRLNDFGKHPGYRKKPMQLPETGSDEFQGNRDWNDESVHNEQPYGQSKGDSKPYEKVVDAITEEIMAALKKKA